MKVCTDACLFGAYIANEILQLPVKNILDIGTGTGLLTLMLSQKTSAAIDAVEIDAGAFTQAKQNIEQSPWKEKIAIYNANILKFQSNKKYDCIISNPPFFEDDLKSNDEKKNFAKHDTSLTFTALLKVVAANLSPAGFFSVLLPFHRSNYFEAEAAKINFNLIKKILINQTPKHNHFRSILIFSTKKLDTIQEEIIIKNEEGNYSTKFIELLKDYYLHL